MNGPPVIRLMKAMARRLQRSGLECIRGLVQIAPALVGVPMGLATLTALGYTVLTKAATSPAIKVLLSLGAFLLMSQWVLAGWDRLPADEQNQALRRWQEVTKRLWRSRTLGLWPVPLVVLTALVGFTDWFPAGGSGRLMMLSSIAAVAIYGYFREKAEKRKDLLAFADEARDRFAEAAKLIHEERDREIEERHREIEARERSAEIDRLADDLEDRFSELKAQAEFLRVSFRDLVDTSELREQLNVAGFSPTDEEFNYILNRLGLS